MQVYRKNIAIVQNEKGLTEYCILPLGLNVNKYEVLQSTSTAFELISKDKHPDDFYQLIRLSKTPLFKELYFNNKKTKTRERLKISLVYNNEVLLKCINLINEEHYKPNIPQGLFVTLSNASDIIGVIVFSKLTYTNPKGRKKFFSETFRANDGKIKEYGLRNIGWISRIVIKKDFHHLGYGSFFAQHFDELVLTLFPNGKLTYIEVLTSWTIEDFNKKIDKELQDLKNAVLNEKNDFLCKAKFERVDFEKPVLRFSKRGGENKKKVIQYYYVKGISK